jgi:YidC/Oxa1 family membrane protein insertase
VTRILDPLYIAVAWVIMRIHAGVSLVLSPNSGLTWVLTIAILVIAMRLVLLPLFIKQMHATRKMSALAPQMAELRKRYKNDRQTLNEETMKLYRENGVNPLGGCLPLVAQLPLFFALFGVLRAISGWHPGLPLQYGLTHSVVISALHANIFGATIADKFLFAPPGESVQARIVICFAVVVSVITTYLTVRQSTKRGMTPQMTPDNPMAASQKYMIYIVPLFALSGLYWAFGLVLYWMMTNLWTLGQQHVLFKRMPSLTAPVTPAGGTGTAAGGPKPGTGDRKPGAGGKPAAGGPKQVNPKQVSGGPKQVSGGTRPAGGKPAAGAKPTAGARPAAAKQPPAGAGQSSNGAKPAAPGQQKRPAPAAGKPAPAAGKPAPAAGKPAPAPAGKRPAAPAAKQAPAGQARPAAAQGGADGKQAPANGSGLLRRFGLGRAEPEQQQAETPDVKLVRHQRVRQPRSKRSGKR